MKRCIFVLIVICFVLSGCIVWDADYTPNWPVTQYSVSEYSKVPITYSMHFGYSHSDLIGLPSEKELQEKVETALQATGLFSMIQCTNEIDRDGYHVDFLFFQGGMNWLESDLLGRFLGATFCLIPCVEVFTFDGSAYLYLQGKSIYSTAKAEEQRTLFWLPLAPVGLIMNDWRAWNNIVEGTVNALVEDIAEVHQKRFL